MGVLCASFCVTRLQQRMESMESIESLELAEPREIEKEAGKPSQNHVPVCIPLFELLRRGPGARVPIQFPLSVASLLYDLRPI